MVRTSHKPDSVHYPSQTVPKPWCGPHALECEVHRRLLALPGVKIHSLVVHRMPQGVCLEGSISETRGRGDIIQALMAIEGVGEVIDHLMRCPAGDFEIALRVEPGDFPHAVG